MSVLRRDLDAYESALDLYQQAARNYNHKADVYDASIYRQDGQAVITQGKNLGRTGQIAFYTVDDAGQLSQPFTNDAYASAPRTPIEGSPDYYLVRIASAAVNGQLPNAPGEFTKVLPKGPDASFAQVRRMNQISLAEQERAGGLLQEAMKAGIY